MQDILALDATAQAALIRNKDVSPLELMQLTIDRAVTVNPQVNAIIYHMYEEALAEAKQQTTAAMRSTDRAVNPPFWGVPFLIKDLNDVAGVPTSHGSRFVACAYENGAPLPTRDDPIVARLRQAGLNVFGKTNTAELGLLPTTEPEFFGPTKNPWDMTRTAGGSSGGAAAAVAAGIVSIAHASDSGGSIRIPASCCGLFGFKPSRHPLARGAGLQRQPVTSSKRGIPTRADAPFSSFNLLTEHVITRSVRDSATMYDWLHNTDYFQPHPDEALKQRPIKSRLRIGYSTVTPDGKQVHPHCRDAVIAAAQLMSQLGHDVEEATPPLDGKAMTQAFMTLWAYGCASSVYELARRLQSPISDALDGFEPVTKALVARATGLTPEDIETAEAALTAATVAMHRFFEMYDVWLTPTLAAPPVPLGTFHYDSEVFHRTNAFSPFTPIANVAGLPAMSLPLGSSDSLPIGVQCVGRPGDDKTLLTLALDIEEAEPWHDQVLGGV